MTDIKIILEDGAEFHGKSFGYQGPAAGEFVFNTAMTGYPESLTDPSYKGQILVMTYPLTGNYGIPGDDSENDIPKFFESCQIHVSAIVTADYTNEYSHWCAGKSLDEWMKQHRIPGVYGVDTRALTKHLRENGTMLGKIIYKDQNIAEYNPYDDNLVDVVSCREKIVYGDGAFRILLVDCGVRYNIIRELIAADATVVRVPWNYDFLAEDYDGLMVSNGPGDPKKCKTTIENIAKALQRNQPIMGIGLGCQIMGLAAGADTFKMKCGHRGHNQPIIQAGTNTTFITAQNHSFAIDTNTLSGEWESFYVNLNDGTNEGIRHKTKPFFATQFHREPSAIATDSECLSETFIVEVKKYKANRK